MYVYIYVYAHARTHAPRARGRRRRRRRRRVEYEPATPRTPRTPHDVDPRPMATHRAVARDAKSHDARRQMTARSVERRSIALKNRTHAGHHRSSSVTSGAPPDVVRTCGTVIFFFTGERRTRSGACARECAHRTRRRTHATHGGCPPPRVDDVGARD